MKEKVRQNEFFLSVFIRDALRVRIISCLYNKYSLSLLLLYQAGPVLLVPRFLLLLSARAPQSLLGARTELQIEFPPAPWMKAPNPRL